MKIVDENFEIPEIPDDFESPYIPKYNGQSITNDEEEILYLNNEISESNDENDDEIKELYFGE